MKIHQYNQMMKYLVDRKPRKLTEEKAREELKLPKETKLTGSKMLNWVNYNNKVHGNNTQPVTAEEKKVAEDVEAQQNKKWTYESWADGLEERTRPAKKAPVKIVKKPKPIKPLTPLDPLYDWRLAPWWEYPEDDDAKPEEDKTRTIRTGITKLI